MSVGATEATRQSDWVVPPRAGEITVLATSTTAASLDMRTLGPQTPRADQSFFGTTSTSDVVGAPGHYVTIYADGQDVGVIFGPTQASVTTGNAPVLATTGTNAAGCCWRIVAGTSANFKLAAGFDLWLGYVGAGSGNMRVYVSSP